MDANETVKPEMEAHLVNKSGVNYITFFFLFIYFLFFCCSFHVSFSAYSILYLFAFLFSLLSFFVFCDM